ncbi:HAD family hydrolase [Kribbella deserti]|uniref:HAD family hydrolase n=1 Tax=Kribbella deserti TaxID=1926257 RepID=A0ABV6QUI9_9ACTN
MIKGLLLDFYGTVVEDDDAYMERIAAYVASRASVPISADDVGRAWTQEYYAAASGPVFRTLRECARTSLGIVMAEVGCAGDPAELCGDQFRSWQTPPLRSGTREFLSAVDLPICIVSDVDRHDLDAALAYHGLAFTAVVTSEDVGAYKPDQAMFTTALATLKRQPDEVMHVGDSLTSDIAGAHTAGIRAIWINRHNRPTPADAPSTHEIPDLSALTAILDRQRG